MAKGPVTSVYVHVPFCRSKCAYCAFYSVPDAPPDLRKRYLKRLGVEALEAGARCGPLETLYVGGGTPTCLEEAELEQLLACLREAFEFSPDTEFSVECNPDSFSPEKARILVRHGVNRISLGIQSFNRTLRRTLGRQGSLNSLPVTLTVLRSLNITNIGADLIYAIPGQTPAAWREELGRACDLGICHLSTYELTIEEGTRLAGAGVAPVGEEETLAMWHAGAQVASDYGLERYEVSNLALPRFECRHNDAVWHGGHYLGLGPAASSYDGEARRTNPSDLSDWLEGGQATRDVLAPDQRAAEVLGFGLRTVRGWTAEEFHRRTGHDYLELRGPAIRELAEHGLLVLEEDRLRPAQRGLALADYVARTLL
jgi:oxygen-independent coproporphyrinogen-3 oxidase